MADRRIKSESEIKAVENAVSGQRNTADAPLGWHVISGEDLLEALRRCAAGENADLVYAELWANAEHEKIEGEETAEAREAQLRQALERFGRHRYECAIERWYRIGTWRSVAFRGSRRAASEPPPACSCGFTAALAGLPPNRQDGAA